MQASGQARLGLLRMTSRPIGALLLVLAGFLVYQRLSPEGKAMK